MKREYDKDGRLLNAAYHMRLIPLDRRNEAIALSPNVIDLRNHHKGYVGD